MLAPLIASSWDGYAIWQWSNGQDPQGPDLSVPGVEGRVDLNVMSADDLSRSWNRCASSEPRKRTRGRGSDGLLPHARAQQILSA